MQDKIFNMLLQEDEITWQTMIYELVRKENMDPWDVDVSLLSQKFIEMLKELKEMDFRVSGKVILASAILLKMQSNRLVGEDLAVLDQLIASSEETEEEFYDELEQEYENRGLAGEPVSPELIPRTPQPRKRKVSVFDLVDALQKALEVDRRRVRFRVPPAPEVKVPEKKREISLIIRDIHQQIRQYFLANKANKLTFSQLIPSESREDKVYTFIPLLHLTNDKKIDLHQEQHFGEIEIYLAGKLSAD